MTFRFGIVVVLLIFDVAFVWSTEDKNSDNDDSSRDSKDDTELSAGIYNNPFLQEAAFSNVQDNPFLNNITSSDTVTELTNIPFSSNTLNENTRTQSGDTVYRVDPVPITHRPYQAVPVPSPHTPYRPLPPNTPSHGNEPSVLDLLPVKIGPPKTTAELKCEEYARYFAGTTDVAALVGTSSAAIKLDNVCRDANHLVVHGEDAKIGEFPHMVALGKRVNGKFRLICGASLISRTWVLSAAHCTHEANGSPTDARVGFHQLTDEVSGVTIVIKRMIRHPNYNPPAKYADIALVELTNSVVFNTLIRPACLYHLYGVPPTAFISGWGVTEYAGDFSDKLQKAQVDMVENLACTVRHNTSKEAPHGITPNMVCAGDPRGGWSIDTCQGDSGGPLQIIHPKNQCLFQVIGITSFGQGCAIFNAPGVYTRVSHYRPWIENFVWPQGQGL